MAGTNEGEAGFSFTSNSLQMYSALVNMGFQDDLSIKAAQKFPNSSDEAINWILEQQSNTDPQQSSTPSGKTPSNSDKTQTPKNPCTTPQSKPIYEQKSELGPGEDLKAWIIQNNLSQNIVNALLQNDVDSLEDLKLLQSDQEIREFASDLGLKIMAKKKFVAAVKRFNSQHKPANNAMSGSIGLGSFGNDNQSYAVSMQQNSQFSQFNPYQQQPKINPHKSDKKESDIKLNEEEIKKQQRQIRNAHLNGDVRVQYSFNKRSLDSSKKNRCILVIGATGTGKTTCLNSMMNYLWEVEYEDSYRYKLIMESSKADQSKSQTKNVTAYYLNPPALDYSLTLVDTPGYGDTDGLTEDDKITKRIKHFFDKEIQSIDAVCFVIRAPQARLTKAQEYVFTKILNVFGKDIKDNIFILLTFADGYPPPALAAIKKANIPYKKAFKLNNAGFFLGKDKADIDIDDGLVDFDDTDTDWNRGMRAFNRFFVELSKVKPKSLVLTRKVLSKREKLQNYVCAIQPTINKAYAILQQMRVQIYEVDRNATIIDKSKDYTYEVEVSKSRRVDVKSGLNTTTCTNCTGQFTCHNDCAYEDNQDKKGCCAMNGDGYCTVCPGKCDWIHHKNLPYLIEFYIEKETKTTKELRDRYVNAQSAQSASDQIIAGLTGDLVKQETKLQRLIENVRQCVNELRRIALQPNIMSKDDYLEQLIEAEQSKRNKGWQSRVKTLQDLKKKDKILMDVASNNFDAQFTNYSDVNQYLDQKNHRSASRQVARAGGRGSNKKQKQRSFFSQLLGI